MPCDACLQQQRSHNLVTLLHSVIETAKINSINHDEIMQALFVQIKLLAVPKQKDFYALRGSLQDMLQNDLYNLWEEFHGE